MQQLTNNAETSGRPQGPAGTAIISVTRSTHVRPIES